MKNGTYCGGHGKTIARNISYGSDDGKVPDLGDKGRKQETSYEYIGTTQMAQSIAYAKYFAGAGEEEIQYLIWASDQWIGNTGGSCLQAGTKPEGPYSSGNNSIYNRASKFANFAYIALNNRKFTIGMFYKR